MNRTFHVYDVYLARAGKQKYVVPVLPYGKQWLCFVINSNLTAAQERLPSLQPCIVALPRATNPYLAWDSFIVVSSGEYVPDDALNHVLGAVSTPCCRSVRDAVVSCTVLPDRTKRLVLEHLVDHVPD